MELQQYGLSYGTTYWGTNLCHGAPSTFDQSRCQQPIKHCDGFTPAKLCFEDNRNIAICSSEKQASFAGTNTPDLYTDLEGKHSPRNGSHCVTLFNGLGKNHKSTPFENGYVGYNNELSCNGFHEPELRDNSLEKTVGHGRPISQSFPKRLPSWGSPVSENDDRLNHDRTQYTAIRMAVDLGKQTTLEDLGLEHTITMALMFANTLANPFIYVACRKRYRHSLKKLLCFHRCRASGVIPSNSVFIEVAKNAVHRQKNCTGETVL